MEADVGVKREFLEKKLDKETTNLEKLKESLKQSERQTGSMLTVLDKFQDRLEKLEGMILPVYEETKSYQTRQDNIDKTLTSIDDAIGFYNVAKNTEEIIKSDNPSQDLHQYMKAMVQVKNAITYFRTQHPGSPEYSAVNTLYQTGKKAIENEFETLLHRHSRPLLPVNIADMLGESEDQDDEMRVTEGGMSPEVYVPQTVREQLQDISKWLVENLSTTDFMFSYASTRANVLKRSLQGLIDHQKSSSGESIVSSSPSVMTNFKSRKSSSRKQLFSKSNKLLKKALYKNADAASKKEEDAFVMEVECYVNCVSALLKLIEYESEMMVAIIPVKHQRKIFDILIKPALDLVFDEGEKLGATAEKAASHNNFKEVPMLFPVVKHLRTVKPQFDLKLEGCQPINRSKLPGLITSLDNTGNKILVLFIESIKNDPDKASNMPIDGTVHELTRNSMALMNTLKEYAEVAGAMLMVKDPMYSSLDMHKNTIKVADYMTKVLSALGMNLKKKAETYSDIYLAAIFMLNNYNYIQSKLHSENLLELIHKYNPEVGQFYEGRVTEQKKCYTESFNGVMHYLTEAHKPMSQHRSSELTKLTDKEKQTIKDKFTGFNKELEDICKTQKAYSIPDPKVRDAIKKDNKAYIVPQYELFREKFLKMNFTKNAEKYIKYTAHDVSDMLDRMFDVTS